MGLFKQISAVLLLAGAALWAADAPEGVPKGAAETSPGVYRFVDKDGKAWIYQKTPFGLSKREEKDSKKPAGEGAAESGRSRMTPFGKIEVQPEKARGSAPRSKSKVQTTVKEEGDTLHFERPTPFGMSRWSKKKDELTADEKALWESQQTAAAGNDSK